MDYTKETIGPHIYTHSDWGSTYRDCTCVPDGVLELKWQVDTCLYHYLRNYLQLNTTCKWKFNYLQGCFMGNNLLLRVGHKSCYRWAKEPEINELFGGSLFTMIYRRFISCLLVFLNLIIYILFYFYPTVPLCI